MPRTIFNHHHYLQVCKQAKAADAQVVVVTKTVDAPMMAQLATHGVQHVGENRVSDALDKQAWLTANTPLASNSADPTPAQSTAAPPRTGGRDQGEIIQGAQPAKPFQWHFIGHLQSKKVTKTVGKFSLIHSVDSSKLAQKISDANDAKGLVQRVLLQVNQAAEPQKYGFTPEDLLNQFADMVTLPGISVEGLMAMAPFDVSDTTVHGVFGAVADLRDRLQDDVGCSLPHLSMGMTNDYHIALEHGATLIRVGRALFNHYDD